MNLKNPWQIYKNGQLTATAKTKENAEKTVKKRQETDKEMNRLNETDRYSGTYEIREKAG